MDELEDIKLPESVGGLDYKKKLLFAASTLAGKAGQPSQKDFQKELYRYDGDHIKAALACFDLDPNASLLHESLIFLEKIA